MPELSGLSSQDALQVVKEAETLAAEEQDVSFYEKATSPRYVFWFAMLLLLAVVVGVALYLAMAFGLHPIFHRSTGAVSIALVVAAYHVFVRIYRRRTPQRMRPYVLKVLERRGTSGQ